MFKCRNIKYLKGSLTVSILLGVLISSAHAQTLFQVNGVDSNDTLNIRQGAGMGNDVVGEIPANEQGIVFLGEERVVGKTRWLKVQWNTVTGWVSDRYMTEYETVAAPENEPEVVFEKTQETKPQAIIETEDVVVENVDESQLEMSVVEDEQDTLADAVKKEWVLQCGNRSPYWRINIHPEMIDLVKGEEKLSLPITAKSQNKNRWNTAIKTVVKGKTASNDLTVTIKYAYSKRCYDTLNNLRVPYKVVTKFNDEEFNGCCRAVELPVENHEAVAVTMVDSALDDTAN